MSKRLSFFNLIKNYNLKVADIGIPLLISTVLTVLVKASGADTLSILTLLFEIGLTVVITVVPLILAAYTIILSGIIDNMLKQRFELSDKQIRNNKTIAEYKKRINSTFALNIIVSSVTMLGYIIGKVVVHMSFFSGNADFINTVTFFLSLALLVFAIQTIIAIAMDLYSIGSIDSVD